MMTTSSTTADRQAKESALPITFSIVGVQKAATSTLYALLGRHRQIAAGTTKERHYFDDETRSWDTRDFSDYHAVRSKSWQRIAGDATPIYLFWPQALDRMRQYNPDMLLIASFRDPIERAFSQWSMERTRNPSFPDFGYAIRDERFHVLPDVEATRSSRPIRQRGLVSRGLYGQQLRRGFESFDPDQWLMFDFRELLHQPEATLDRLTDFLHIHRYNKYPRLQQRNAGQSSHSGTPPTGDDMARLADFYAADLADFTKLSGIDTASWPTSRIIAGELEPTELAERLARRAGLASTPSPHRRGASARSGPAWLGIGAHRSGTTWLTDLLVQHPDVGVGTNGKKEQQALHKIARGQLDRGDYLDLFPDDHLRRGDFTPRYLNNASVPIVAARLVPEDAPIVVILRDPVERFASALRRRLKDSGTAWPYEAAVAYGQWAGMYLPQLDLWAASIDPDRILVFTYEAVRDDPTPMCADIWGRLGLEPVDLGKVSHPSSSSAGHIEWDWPDGLREALAALYSPQLDELAERWGVRTDLWTSFQTDA